MDIFIGVMKVGKEIAGGIVGHLDTVNTMERL